jgi:hypothetical protein
MLRGAEIQRIHGDKLLSVAGHELGSGTIGQIFESMHGAPNTRAGARAERRTVYGSGEDYAVLSSALPESIMSQGLDGIDPGGAECGQVARDERDGGEERGDANEAHGVEWRDAEEQRT